ncbi:glycoside hydrolase family 2 [Pedobacter sp. KBW01]|uniref:sugar-binding domain-containing protein n=1 Tax=Pedobacter sp. KBW01 TaxID=2153364 RepID=UPI000F590D3E|nr:sugar-binding domain-containing protein [Pedobacter sp. KBW01]RQO77772.1 glycoside hydrolase family 2 [Pedobacter sp. KBW01]
MNNLKFYALLLFTCLSTMRLSAQQEGWTAKENVLPTRWAKEVSPARTHNLYPRPQMERNKWENLNGLWQYTITDRKAAKPVFGNDKILVPYPIESALSGVKKALQPDEFLWYQRKIVKPKIGAGERVILHFGAVDYQAVVYLNGEKLGAHIGGYTAFDFDITDRLREGENTLMVRVFDPSDKGNGPHGKQVLKPESIYYTPSSGIWQTVWMETVPAEHIEGLTITPDIDRSLVNVTVNAASNKEVTLVAAGKAIKGRSNKTISIPISNTRLWSPDDPYLYQLSVRMGRDRVKSYFGMRKISIGKDDQGVDRILLNNRFTFNLGTLDQGFWPDGLYTAPNDEALAFDIKAIKSMGFNTIRKHIKVEPARWYYYADKLGLMVWQDMVNPNQGLPEGSREVFESQNAEIIKQLHNYPSITTWVLFNEKWGAYDQAHLTRWLKEVDPTRIVNGHSGEYLYVNNQLRSPSPDAYVNSDMTDVHAYPDPMISLKQDGKAQVCGEFGGIGVPVPGHQWTDLTGWGYVQVLPRELDKRYDEMVKKLQTLVPKGLSASIYTQPFDVEGEENGLMTYDREVIKIPLKRLREIHSQLIKPEDKSFSIDPGFSIGTDIDPNDTDERYAEFLKLFKDGKNDSIFLRRLVLMSLRQKDDSNTQRIADVYFSVIQSPLSPDNLTVLQKTTQSTSSGAFAKLFSAYNLQKDSAAKSEIGKLVKDVIDGEIKSVVFDKNKAPDFLQLRTEADKFGPIGEQAILENIALYYYFQKNLPGFVKTKAEILAKYPSLLSNFTLTNDTWFIFLHANDEQDLVTALEWTKRLLSSEPNNNAAMDTHANILYKLGQREEALNWEKKALAIDPQNKEIKENYNKMLNSLPTWPVK